MQSYVGVIMNNELKKIYSENNDIWGLPQEYKGIKFYPIKLVDSEYLHKFYHVFSYPKNYIPDKQVLKMGYLKFLLYVVQPSVESSGTNMEELILEFLKYVTHSKTCLLNWNSEDDPKSLEDMKLTISIDDKVFDEHDFDNIREIVLEQNGLSVEYVEQYRPDLEEKLNIQNNGEELTLKDKVFAFCVLMQKKIDDVKDYTIFQFNAQLERLGVLKEFELYKPLEATGQIKLQNGSEIKHYLAHIKKSGRYDSILVSKESYMEHSDIFKI